MKQIILYDPSISTLNRGDNIIYESCIEQLNTLFKDIFYINISTHLPISRKYFTYMENIEKKFVLGSNLLSLHMNGNHNQWDITIENADIVGPVIIMGAGISEYSDITNEYTKQIYNKIFDKQYLHSVRDSYTENKLKEMGICNVINTGCPTVWKLSKEHCKTIPRSKAKNVIFTLTDYDKDYENDVKLFKILEENYEELYYWVQGINDYEYIKELGFDNKVKIVGPTLKEYNDFLEHNQDIEYVGTRLHGGIKALQKKKRTIIVSIDNRAKEMAKDINISIVERNKIEKIKDLIPKELDMNIVINEENINIWKSQFIKNN